MFFTDGEAFTALVALWAIEVSFSFLLVESFRSFRIDRGEGEVEEESSIEERLGRGEDLGADARDEGWDGVKDAMMLFFVARAAEKLFFLPGRLTGVPKDVLRRP